MVDIVPQPIDYDKIPLMSKTVILGTAGHIDHGKSSLVRALTGTDPDRLKEEKERGITIELGFARLSLPSGTLAGIEEEIRALVRGTFLEGAPWARPTGSHIPRGPRPSSELAWIVRNSRGHAVDRPLRGKNSNKNPEKNAMKLGDQVAIVTGAARGNGLAIAKMLAGEGCNIVIADICKNIETIPYALSTLADLDKSVEEIEALGVKALGIVCDVRSAPDVKSMVDGVMATFGKIDILVNNAGVMSLMPAVHMDEATWDDTIDTHLKGTFLCCHYVVPHMIAAHSGKVVSISSIGGQRGLGLGSHYCAAKHGIIGFSRSLAMETANHNINVNVVCPGTVWTRLMMGLSEYLGMEQETAKAHFTKGLLFKDREICPEDIAHAVLWFCLPESRCVTGNMISVDSGWTARVA